MSEQPENSFLHDAELRGFVHELHKLSKRCERRRALLAEIQLRQALGLSAMENSDDCSNLGTFDQSVNQDKLGRRWLEPDEKRRAIEACKPTNHIDFFSITKSVSG